MLFAHLSGLPSHPACLRESKLGHLLGSNSIYFYFINDHLEEFGLCDHLAFEVSAVNDKNDSIGTSIVSRPDAANTFLAAEIPCTEFDVFMRDLFDIATNSGSGFNCFAKGPVLEGWYIW